MERDWIRIEWISGLVKLELGETNDAENALTEALTRCRRIRLVEYEADILLALAALRRAQDGGNGTAREEAVKLAREALEIADRCEYRLKQAEIHNFLARLKLDENDGEGAREEAEIARERAYCDGPHFSYVYALRETESILTEIDSS